MRRSCALISPGLRPDENGKPRPGYRKPKPIRDGGLDAEFRWLNSVMNFGCGFKVTGRPILARNPLRHLEWPKEKNPRRPVASHQRFTATMQKVDAVDPAGRLRCILALARCGQAAELAEFVSVILADTEETWRDLFRQSGRDYRKPTLVLFTGAVQSACGFAGAAVGPFYCPPDEQIYIDLSFYQDLAEQYGAPGDFAQAYVLAHEVGHHVQTLLGISEQVRREQTRASRAEANRLSVRLELQADCLAGVWAHHADRVRRPNPASPPRSTRTSSRSATT